MKVYDILEKKKRKLSLTKEEIDFIVQEYTKGSIPDYQMSALLMAICINGMNDEETFNLTIAMKNSGDVLDLSKIEGIKVDKHSTGGVGDKISLILSPMLAALGVKIAKMSGRGLGHTGGTIDKLESIEGFTTSLSYQEFIDNVNNIGMAIASQTANLTPADKKIYALRDVTATVDCIPLIASSIMSKKLASGADAIVLDVKCGNGAFMKNEEEAEKLAKTMVSIGRQAGKNISAIVTDMNQPLGTHIGNSLEVVEAIETLKGNGNSDVLEVTYALGVKMIMFSGIAKTEEEALSMLKEVIENKKAYNKFIDFIKSQKGNPEDVLHPERLITARLIKNIAASNSGYISYIDTESVGKAVQILGGGRETKISEIDKAVGVVINKKLGNYVEKGDVVFKVYGNDEIKVEEAANKLMSAIAFSNNEILVPKIIKKII
ncbi:MAG: thymidine phosphorylase [Lachnospiraceae bacterium]|nr:thymidine phosphorylase [Lachnospiraceae bacterium]